MIIISEPKQSFASLTSTVYAPAPSPLMEVTFPAPLDHLKVKVPVPPTAVTAAAPLF